jgi:NADH dehydrogenase/NADH:ubiquinone oxidoreductase subunit G
VQWWKVSRLQLRPNLNKHRMIRTQVYLTKEQKRAIELWAKREKKQEAVLVRELLDAGLKATSRAHTSNAGQALLDLAKLGKKLGMTGPTDLSTNLDDYLYGDKE